MELGYQVHDVGDRTLDGIFRLIGLGERQLPLDEVLTSMCADVAAIARADVASVYVREETPDGERFTMRGNVGFPREALGRVHLRRGEGLTGFAADRLRPVSVAIADRDEHFKYIPGLGEERFPALLAVPVLRGGAAAGVLVLQRRASTAFTPEEVVLATALAAVINHALERGEERERLEAKDAHRRTVRLGGTTVVPGTAMGRAEVLPTLSALTRTGGGTETAPGPASGQTTANLESSLDAVMARLRADLHRVAEAAPAPAAREIASLSLILDDERFRGRLAEACLAPSPVKALSELARAYARVPFNNAAPADEATAELLGARAAEIEDLCVLACAATTGGRPLVRPGAILVSERLSLLATAYAIAAGASAFVVDGDVAPHGGPAALVRAAGRPLLGSARGVFSWLRPDDLLVVDDGVVRVNPSATTVARFRRAAR